MDEKTKELIEDLRYVFARLPAEPWEVLVGMGDRKKISPDRVFVADTGGTMLISSGPERTPREVAEGLALLRLRAPELLEAYVESLHQVERLHDDVRCLSARAEAAEEDLRYEARSSGPAANALVRLAYGGSEPTPAEAPRDVSDLMACRRALGALPAHRLNREVLEALLLAEKRMVAAVAKRT